MRIKPRRKRVLLPVLSILFLSVCLSACGGKGTAGGAESGQTGQVGTEAETKAFGIDMVDRFNLENPEQVVCGQTCMWAITTRLDGFIYQIDYESDVKEIKEIEWRQGEEESLVNIAERKGILYAEVYLKRENVFEIRRQTAGSQWSTVMTVRVENPEWCYVGSGLFLDSSENVYLMGGNTVTRFAEGGTKTGEYELDGEACFFRENEDGVVECVAAKTNGIMLYALGDGKAEEKWTLQISAGDVRGMKGNVGAPLCLAVGTELLFIDWETGALLARTDLLLAGVSSCLAGRYDANAETLRLYGMGGQSESSGNLTCSLLSERDAAAEQRIELVYGTLGMFNADAPADIRAAIMAFNQENDKYYVTIRNYYSEEDLGITTQQRFLADMAAGNAPDIIDISALESYYEPFVNNGYLEDLRPYLEQSEYKDDILWNVLNAYEVDGGLYLLAPQFYFFGVLIHPEYACPLEEWNTDTFLSMIEENGWEKNIYNIYQSNPLSLLYQIFACRQGEFINKEQGTASFETQEFIDMLVLCREYAENCHTEEDSWGDEWNNLCAEQMFSYFYHYIFNTDVYGREYQIYGYPTSDGQVYQVSSSDSCAIYAGSEHKEGAWEFLESLLKEENQKFHPMAQAGVPIRRSVLENMKEEEWKDVTCREGDELLTMSEEEYQIIENVVYNGVFVPDRMNEDIWDIIEEEAAAYFAGDKSAEDVAHIIQSRVGLLLAE